MRKSVLLLFAVLFLSSCNSNDDDSSGELIDLAKVLVEDEAEIKKFLQTHFYNEDEFLNPPADFDFAIRLGTIEGENADRTPLIDQVSSKIINVNDAEGNNVPHTLYYLVAREGVGAQPTVADSVEVQFKAQSFDIIFQSVPTPSFLDLPGALVPKKDSGVILTRGLVEGITELRAGDDTNDASGFGSGLIIMPSALGLFDIESGPALPAFSPLIYTVRLFSVQETDHDQDGVLSILEDANGDNILFNDDADNDGIPDYLDSDTN